MKMSQYPEVIYNHRQPLVSVSYEYGEIDIELLKAKKIVSKRIKDVKVVNGGELTKAIKLKGIKTSKSVAELIIKLGGEIN